MVKGQERSWAVPRSDACRTAQEAGPGAGTASELPCQEHRGPANSKDVGAPGEGSGWEWKNGSSEDIKQATRNGVR